MSNLFTLFIHFCSLSAPLIEMNFDATITFFLENMVLASCGLNIYNLKYGQITM